MRTAGRNAHGRARVGLCGYSGVEEKLERLREIIGSLSSRNFSLGATAGQASLGCSIWQSA
jgi:hypothetical protein